VAVAICSGARVNHADVYLGSREHRMEWPSWRPNRSRADAMSLADENLDQQPAMS
jgi:hypothetical protein